MLHLERRLRAVPVLVVGLLLSLLPAGPVQASPVATEAAVPSAVTAPAATTSSREAKRVDRVATPKLKWSEVADGSGYSASVKLPLDYDSPKGAKVKVALFKIPAADPANRIGTLFLNPGGPGGSGVALAKSATTFLSQDVLDRFDIVGFDPRGTNSSSQVRCFASSNKQSTALAGMDVAFPTTSAEEKRFLKAAAKEAKACSKKGRKLASAMSTAEVARDLDVLRRAVGDAKLSYLGFSYGTYLGEVYANMFPDRFRAMALDGVVNPTAWAGADATRSTPTTLRIRSAEGSWKALQTGLEICAARGFGYCPLSSPKADFDRVATGLRSAGSVLVADGDSVFTYTYSDYISAVLGLLYYPGGMEYIAQLTATVDGVLNPGTTQTLERAGSALITLVRSYRKSVQAQSVLTGSYDNELDAYSGVICTDSYEPRDPGTWVSAANQADASAPYFGRVWAWSDVQCATKYWKAKDEDAYRGGFSAVTAAPVLIVGNYYDPATNYDNAVTTAQLMPNSYLLSSTSWGHTAYGTSDCVTDRIDAYLLAGAEPDETVCSGDLQPFDTPLESVKSTARSLAKARAGLPPVTQPWAGE
ncbi:MAG TPA: alpha/beta hydrolase [Propionicimonas sp.]|nr:alpha/beta hydrolase [Propionicimonas sp.]HRA07324.1 alpha/beta hydrolase [Propionicimonas sp.]